MNNFSMSFDQASLSHITKLYGFGTLLSPAVQAAMNQGGDIILAAAQDNAYSYFANPTGQLSSSLSKMEQTPYEVIIQSDSPYAHRRDQGFVGADSLGRVYNDQPYLFMTNALAQNESAVLDLIFNAVSGVVGSL